jgi:hypothetical protein
MAGRFVLAEGLSSDAVPIVPDSLSGKVHLTSGAGATGQAPELLLNMTFQDSRSARNDAE